MTREEFNKKVHDATSAMKDLMDGRTLESVATWMGEPLENVFVYGATSEATMEKQLNATGHERKTTFMSDLSIGEWCEGMYGVLDTWKRVMMSLKDDVEFMSEFVLCVNWKSWEHYERKNNEWSRFYSFLYEYTRDIMYDYYEGDEEKTSYMYNYLD